MHNSALSADVLAGLLAATSTEHTMRPEVN